MILINFFYYVPFEVIISSSSTFLPPLSLSPSPPLPSSLSLPPSPSPPLPPSGSLRIMSHLRKLSKLMRPQDAIRLVRNNNYNKLEINKQSLYTHILYMYSYTLPLGQLVGRPTIVLMLWLSCNFKIRRLIVTAAAK